MNSFRARRLFPEMLVIAIVFTGPSLLAQVKLNTPGSQFSIVGGHGTFENVVDGRRFRSEHEPLKIRGILRTPSHARPSDVKLQRLAVHFHSTPHGATLLSVQICNPNCGSKFEAGLSGDYATKEIEYSKGVQYANTWVFNPPVLVGPQLAVVLEIRPAGAYEGGIPAEDLEFTLTSVVADFPASPLVHLGSATVATTAPFHKGPAKVATTTSIWPNGKAYFFIGSEYVRYDAKTDKVDPDYPQPIAGHWSGFPPDFEAGIDAEVVWNNGKAYFFKDDHYLCFDIASDKVDRGYPQPIVAHWPGIWTDHIDAAVVWPNGKAYFFKGSQYIRYDLTTDKADPGYPAAIRDAWHGFPPAFAAGIDRAVVWNNGKAYFFKGNEYIRYDIATDKTDEGPVPIARNWHGWPRQPVGIADKP